VGCGGGVFPTFLYRNFPNLLTQTVVELDPDVVAIAKEHFGMPSFSPRGRKVSSAESKQSAPIMPLTVLVQDGLQYVEQLAKACSAGGSGAAKVDILIFDVDSKDNGDGMACPPKAFVQPLVLRDAHTTLAEGGVFVLNLVCRSKPLFQSTVDALDAVFETVLVLPVTEWQSMLFAFKGPRPSQADAVAAARRMVQAGKAAPRNTWDEDLHDLPERVGKLAEVPKPAAAASSSAAPDEESYGDALD
jgi:spermidine synthase